MLGTHQKVSSGNWPKPLDLERPVLRKPPKRCSGFLKADGRWPFSSISLEESIRNAESCVSRSWSEPFLPSRRRCLFSSCESLSAMELCCAQFIPRFLPGWNTSCPSFELHSVPTCVRSLHGRHFGQKQ